MLMDLKNKSHIITDFSIHANFIQITVDIIITKRALIDLAL